MMKSTKNFKMSEVVNSTSDSYQVRTLEKQSAESHRNAVGIGNIKKGVLNLVEDLGPDHRKQVIVNQQTIYPPISGMMQHRIGTSSVRSRLIRI